MKTLPEKRKGVRSAADDSGSGGWNSSTATITMRPTTKARLKALAALKNQAPWRIIEDAIAKYVETLEPKDRMAVEPLVKRVESMAEAAERDRG